MEKTYKREAATVLLAWIIYLSVYGELEVLRTAITPVFAFAGMAFGMDWFHKQHKG